MSVGQIYNLIMFTAGVLFTLSLVLIFYNEYYKVRRKYKK